MEFQMFLAFAVISMWMSAHGEESPAEAYWKMKLGNDVTMPKVVKDALLVGMSVGQVQVGRRSSKNYQNFKDNAAQVYAQQLSGIRTNRPTKSYSNAARDYAQQLSGIRTNKAYNIYSNNAAQTNTQKLSEILGTNLQNQFTSSKGTDNKKNYEASNGQVYAQQPSKVNAILANQNVNNNAAQTYAQQLSGTKNNIISKIWYSKSSKLITDNSILFFFQNDLFHPGLRMKLHFLMGAQDAKFMPLQIANSIPFSSNKLLQILQFFAVNPDSENAKIIEETITLCESKPIKGEEKSCKISLETLVDYAKSHVGNQIKAVSTEIDKETEEEYEIESAKKIKNEKNLVCHKIIYPYAVFYCHTLSKTDAYEVSLIDTNNGKQVRAVAVCHKDTSPWNPQHLAFQLLKVKPGGVPICHFLNVDAMIWVPK